MEIFRCEICPLLGESAGAPVPPTIIPNSPLLIIGEAPGSQEVAKGKPFVGPSGKLLRALVKEAGFKEEWMVSYGNAANCFPQRKDNATGKMGIRQPSRDELGGCRGHLQKLFSTVGPQVVLLAGAVALSTWRTDLSVSKNRGVAGRWWGRWTVIPTYHPSSVLRGQEENKHWIKTDIENAYLICTGMGPEAFRMERCVKCGDVATEWDDDLIAYCGRHWQTWMRHWQKERKEWQKVRAKMLQPRML